jgi:murein DD-endopeptidase MepM/ murein hydrolase activator NlpD
VLTLSPTFVARPERATRHASFLNYSRRTLGIGAVFATMSLMSIPALPATADIVEEEVQASVAQSFATPPISVAPAIVRDAFGVSSYTVVQWPVPSTTEISDWFGYRSCSGCSSDHHGIDFNPGAGYPIQAIADGVVSAVGNPDGDLGVYVTVVHVVDGQPVSSVYAHMQYGSMTLAVGDAITRGQVLGLVGDTGLSTGPHLHFGILEGGVAIDPYPWILAHANI